MSFDGDQLECVIDLNTAGHERRYTGPSRARIIARTALICCCCVPTSSVCVGRERASKAQSLIETSVSGSCQLAIPRALAQLADEKRRLTSEIEKLETGSPQSLLLAQYRAVLRSVNANLNFHARNNLVDEMLAMESQIKELARRLARPAFSMPLRRELWERDARTCYLCRRPIGHWDGESMHVDHVTPRIKGGSDAPENLRVAHPLCNLKKGDRELRARRMKAILAESRKSEEEKARHRLF